VIVDKIFENKYKNIQTLEDKLFSDSNNYSANDYNSFDSNNAYKDHHTSLDHNEESKFFNKIIILFDIYFYSQYFFFF